MRHRTKLFNTIFLISMLAISLALLPATAGAGQGQSVGAPAFIPACEPDVLPDQAKVPCQGIIEFNEGITEGERTRIIKAAGASLRFNYHIVNAAAKLFPARRPCFHCPKIKYQVHHSRQNNKRI